MSVPVLGYATNCYSGESAAELIAAVSTEVAAVRKLLPPGEPLNLSLRISAQAAAEIAASHRLLDELRGALSDSGAGVVGANAFPIAAPRRGVYKDGIYRPDWQSLDRLEATLQIARIVAELLPEGARGVLTTLTGTYRLWAGAEAPAVEEACARNLLDCAQDLDQISARTGRDLVLALEPEPFSTAEGLADTLRYFHGRLFGSAQQDSARRRLALNLDLCHAAVMFEDPVENLRACAREGLAVAGIHVSAALRLENPGDNAGGMAELRRFDEPVYLHQVTAVDRSGRIAFRSPDLGEFLALPPERLAEFGEARIHFHVPIFSEGFGELGSGIGDRGSGNGNGTSALNPRSPVLVPQSPPLGTTAGMIAPAIAEARAGNLTDLFVVETYTWKQLEGTDGAAPTVAEGIAAELVAARGLLGG